MKDQRWPFLLFVIVRAVQLLLSVICVALSAYVTSKYSDWFFPLGLVVSIVSDLYLGASFFLFFTNRMLPLVAVIFDAFCFLFFLIAMAGNGAAGYISGDCTFYAGGYYYGSYYKSTGCQVGKGVFGISLILFLMYGVTLGFSSFILHKNRKDLRGKKYASGAYDNDIEATDVNPETGIEIPVVGIPLQETKMDYQQPAVGYTPIQSPAPQFYQQPPPVQKQQVYTEQPQGFQYAAPQQQEQSGQTYYQPQDQPQYPTVSPVGTPAPEPQQGVFTPPPVDTTEMPECR